MFRARTRTFAFLATSTVAAGLLTGAHPAAAAPPVFAASAGPAALLAAGPADPTDRYRVQVRRLADLDPRWEVSNAAWSALVSDRPDEPRAFLLPGGGYEQARKRATTNASRNNLIINRAIATSTPATSPFVNMTAKRASFGTLAEKDRYVRTGLKEAQDLDAKHSPVAVAKEQAKEDRAYVADLVVNGSGAWVQAAARRATELGTDADIVEFFKYAWGSAADCDLQAYRMELIEQQLKYRNDLDNLIVAAEQAQRDYEGAADAAKAKAAEEARAKWNHAADTAAATQATWLANQELATRQAQMWAAVHDFAVKASTQQDWPGIATKATATGGSWADELAWAQEQERQWTELAASARASATAIPDPDATPTPDPTATPPAGARPDPEGAGRPRIPDPPRSPAVEAEPAQHARDPVLLLGHEAGERVPAQRCGRPAEAGARGGPGRRPGQPLDRRAERRHVRRGQTRR